jgi:hypothetical protein
VAGFEVVDLLQSIKVHRADRVDLLAERGDFLFDLRPRTLIDTRRFSNRGQVDVVVFAHPLQQSLQLMPRFASSELAGVDLLLQLADFAAEGMCLLRDAGLVGRERLTLQQPLGDDSRQRFLDQVELGQLGGAGQDVLLGSFAPRLPFADLLAGLRQQAVPFFLVFFALKALQAQGIDSLLAAG